MRAWAKDIYTGLRNNFGESVQFNGGGEGWPWSLGQGLCGLVPLARIGVLEDISSAYSGTSWGWRGSYMVKQGVKSVNCQDNKFLLGLMLVQLASQHQVGSGKGTDF